MRVCKKSNNILKMFNKNKIIYVAYKDFSLMNRNYFRDVIRPIIIEQDKNYIILTGISYNIEILCFDDIEKFIEGCCGAFGLGLNKEDILKYVK